MKGMGLFQMERNPQFEWMLSKGTANIVTKGRQNTEDASLCSGILLTLSLESRSEGQISVQPPWKITPL